MPQKYCWRKLNKSKLALKGFFTRFKYSAKNSSPNKYHFVASDFIIIIIITIIIIIIIIVIIVIIIFTNYCQLNFFISNFFEER